MNEPDRSIKSEEDSDDQSDMGINVANVACPTLPVGDSLNLLSNASNAQRPLDNGNNFDSDVSETLPRVATSEEEQNIMNSLLENSALDGTFSTIALSSPKMMQHVRKAFSLIPCYESKDGFKVIVYRWKTFGCISADSRHVRCNLCHADLSYAGRSVTPFRRHLSSSHGNFFMEIIERTKEGNEEICFEKYPGPGETGLTKRNWLDLVFHSARKNSLSPSLGIRPRKFKWNTHGVKSKDGKKIQCKWCREYIEDKEPFVKIFRPHLIEKHRIKLTDFTAPSDESDWKKFMIDNSSQLSYIQCSLCGVTFDTSEISPGAFHLFQVHLKREHYAQTKKLESHAVIQDEPHLTTSSEVKKCANCQSAASALEALPCGHLSCSSCNKKLSFKCNVCKSVTLETLLLIPSAANEEQTSEMCFSCPEKATSYCTNCEDNLCPCCTEAHARVKLTSNHKIIPCRKLKNVCANHGEKLINYCLTCFKSICKKCEGDHVDHLLKSWNSEDSATLKEIAAAQAKLNECDYRLDALFAQLGANRSQWNSLKKSTVQELNAYFEQLQLLLFQQRRNCEQSLQDHFDLVDNQLNVQMNNYNSLKSKNEQLSLMARFASSLSEPNGFCAVKALLHEHVNNVSTAMEQRFIETKPLPLNLNLKEAEAYIKTIGQCESAMES